jgi:hypothetical protein
VTKNIGLTYGMRDGSNASESRKSIPPANRSAVPPYITASLRITDRHFKVDVINHSFPTVGRPARSMRRCHLRHSVGQISAGMGICRPQDLSMRRPASRIPPTPLSIIHIEPPPKKIIKKINFLNGFTHYLELLQLASGSRATRRRRASSDRPGGIERLCE